MSRPKVRVKDLVALPFKILLDSVMKHEYTHYWCKGGRGSTKSSFIAIAIVLLILANPNANAVVIRKVANTLRDSVVEQIAWAIDMLQLTPYFKMTKSPYEYVYIPTGQRIVFRGADKPEKLKSIKFSKGYPAIVWFEELDQFAGMAEIRSILQSLMRGGERFWVFGSYNPPKSRDNWVNKEVLIPNEQRFVHESSYLDVPREWLGEAFITEAESLKERNRRAYDHEYGGEVTGTGGAVFDNVTVRKITEEERSNFEYIYNGVDWGYFPDPWVFIRCSYDKRTHTLYIFDEASGTKLSNKQTAEIITEKLTYQGMGDTEPIFHRELIRCDSAEPKSVEEYKRRGLYARGADKPPGSVEYGMKWLQTLTEIVIDPSCELAAVEFSIYEYEQNRWGEWLSGYPDADNHTIDTVRYAMSKAMTRRKA